MIALLRMSPLMSGAIYLDDLNIATVPLFKLRSAVAIIPQVKRPKWKLYEFSFFVPLSKFMIIL